MANAARDENNVATLIAVSSADGTTPTRVYADPDSHRLLVDTSGGVTPVADGTYTVGLGTPVSGTNGTITVENGIITAIQQAT